MIKLLAMLGHPESLSGTPFTPEHIEIYLDLQRGQESRKILTAAITLIDRIRNLKEVGKTVHIQDFQTTIEIDTPSQDLRQVNHLFDRTMQDIKPNLDFGKNWEILRRSLLRKDVLTALGFECSVDNIPTLEIKKQHPDPTTNKPIHFSEEGDSNIFLVRSFRQRFGGWTVSENLVIASDEKKLRKYCQDVLGKEPKSSSKSSASGKRT